MKKISFFFDFLSPYSYLAWTWVRKQHGYRSDIDFEFIPVILGKIIHHYDTKGPAEIRPKREFLFKDCLRYAKIHRIPFTPPAQLPFNSLYALRMSVIENAGIDQFKVIDTIFLQGWENGVDIGNPDQLVRILNENNLPGQRLLDLASDRKIKMALKNNVESAIFRTVFGLPAFIVDGELFWGNDSIDYLELFIEGKDPLDKEAFKQFVAKWPGE